MKFHLAEAGSHDGGSWRQHLRHAGAAFRALIPNHNHCALRERLAVIVQMMQRMIRRRECQDPPVKGGSAVDAYVIQTLGFLHSEFFQLLRALGHPTAHVVFVFRTPSHGCASH